MKGKVSGFIYMENMKGNVSGVHLCGNTKGNVSGVHLHKNMKGNVSGKVVLNEEWSLVRVHLHGNMN